jgi:hypothetical protein
MEKKLQSHPHLTTCSGGKMRRRKEKREEMSLLEK